MATPNSSPNPEDARQPRKRPSGYIRRGPARPQTPSTSSDANGELKQTNQQDRYLRPSLSQHGARSFSTDRKYNPNRRANTAPAPRPVAGRNPRLSEGRPVINRTQTNRPTS